MALYFRIVLLLEKAMKNQIIRLIVRKIAGIALALLIPATAMSGTLADSPLSLKGSVPPNVMFALSVEFPTAITAAYMDNSYSPSSTYLGYFDPEKCYTYDSSTTINGISGWFAPSSLANSHLCTNAWSGNFLNWATMTGLDEFRYAMTGGNRVVDTSTVTVLERSYQSVQGSASSNFPIKSYTGSGMAPFPFASSIGSIQNNGRGLGVYISGTTSPTAECTNPSLSGSTFSCDISIPANGETGSCTTFTGTGTSTSPYRCTTFGAWSGGETYSSISANTISSASLSGSEAVTCSSPSYSAGSFSCTLTNSSGTNGSCNSWGGSGTSSAPYYCATFGSFGTQSFAASSQAAASNFSASVSTTNTFTDNTLSCSVSGKTISCPLNVSGDATRTASCTANKGSGTSSSPYYCNSSAAWSMTGTPAAAFSTVTNSGTKVSLSSKYYYLPTSITYTAATTSTQTIYYIPSYTGSSTTSYSYYSTYSLSSGTTATTFNVRVKVCDSSVGLESNCKQYGSSWKPTGTVQDNGGTMRFGVMSYFQANDIDNAVLRSKLKFVAPQKYSSSGGTIANTLSEWNATDGTLNSSPDATDTATMSTYPGGSPTNTGVINYINKFGSSSHTYKTYDDTGKLYYETLRYLRGTQSPTTDFYNGATATNNDGFPVITTWDDPQQYSCQKNYIITMGDTHTWCDKRLPGGSNTSVGSSVCNAYTDANGHAHVADFSSLSGDTGVNVTTETNKVGSLEGIGNIATTLTGAGSSAGYGMAGLAQWAASQDIRPDNSSVNTVGKQTVKSFVIDVNESKDCGYRSQYWLTAKYGNPESYDSSGNWLTSGNPWTSTMTLPGGACSSRAPPWYSSTATASGTWPAALLRASDPAGMINSVKSAVASIAAQVGDESALAQSSGSLDTGTGAYIYRAKYNSGGWYGDVEALTIDTAGNIATSPAWSSAAKLPTASSRVIFTYNDGFNADGSADTVSSLARQGVLFSSANFANLSVGQQANLNANEFGTFDGDGAERVDFLRGDTTNESPNGRNWRPRNGKLLGDFIHSNPTFVAAPPAGITGKNYRAFALTWKNRKPMLYVGGNDGMLHAFDASFSYNTAGNPVVTSTSGTEVFAYVPSSVYPHLSKLTAPNYSHRYFVDATPVVGQACFGSDCAAGNDKVTDWKTVLIGTLSAGGQGVFALDVTDPDSFTPSSAASKALWEFTDKNDADLGYTFSQPVIRKLNSGKWAVIFGNGYNNTEADSSTSSTGRAYLYVLLIDGPGSGQTWVKDTNYFKIELKSPSEATGTLPNGLSSVVAVDKDFNGTADYIYAGDRNGNLWKVDISNSNPSSWRSAFGTVTDPLPLFSAKDDVSPTPNLQQITSRVEVVRHPNGGFLITFGTGSWVDVTDPLTPFKTQSLYGIWDKDNGSTRVTARSQLQEQKRIMSVFADGTSCDPTTDGASCLNVLSSCVPNYVPGTDENQTNEKTLVCPSDIAYTQNKAQLGWVLDLPASGERTFSSRPDVAGSVVTYSTLQPSADPCTGNTIGYEYNMSILTGGAPSVPVFWIPGTQGGIIMVNSIPGDTSSPKIAVIASGHTTTMGASDNPVYYNANMTEASMGGTVTLPEIESGDIDRPTIPTVACTGSVCEDQGYLPGWGFPMNLRGKTNRYVVSCRPPQFGGGLPTCEWKYRTDQFGRISWRQITD